MDGNCWIEIQGTTEGWMHRPQKKKALRLILIFLIIVFIGLPLFTQTTNTSFSHIESRFASTFLENCLHSVHNSARKR